MRKTIILLQFVAILGLVSCGGGSGKTGGNGSKLGQCFGSTGQTCTGVDAYESCEISHCDTQYKKCFGSGYQSGNYSGGVCQTFITCLSACDCGDSSCQLGCFNNSSTDCTACLQNDVEPCVQAAGCTQPTCTGGGGNIDAGATGDSCTMLKACCPKLPTDAQAGCNQIADGNDQNICGQTLTAFGTICN